MGPRVEIFLGYFFSIIHRSIEIVGRWIFLLIAYTSGPSETSPPIENGNEILHTLNELSMMIRQNKISSENAVKAYIKRIKEIQPILNCMTEDRFDAALKEARECDAILNSSDAASIAIVAKNKPFFGVPFTIRDGIEVKGMKLTGGLVIRRDIRASEDATAIKLIRRAGAIPLAITNIDELGRGWESSNCLYGTTRNPYNTWHIVGGGCGGEGAMLAAAGSCFGIGSGMAGSIRMPCFFNGIFGHKPSSGVVPNAGHYPCCNTKDQDHLLGIGPMSRYATDLKPILSVLAGENVSKLKLDTKVDISKLKFYYMEDNGGESFVSPVSPDIKRAMNNVISHLTSAYKVKVEKVKIEQMKNSRALWTAMVASPKGKDFAHELANRDGRIVIWWEFIKWATFTGHYSLVALIAAAVDALSASHGSRKKAKLVQKTRELRKEFQNMLGEDGIFLYPTHPTPAPLHYEPFLKLFNFSYTAIINCLGLPATACPLGFSDGLPIGIQVVAGLNQDHLTLAVAEELERKFGGWVPPGMNKNASNTAQLTDSKNK